METSRIDGTKTAQVRNGAEGIDLAAFPKFALAREDRWDAYMREEACGRALGKLIRGGPLLGRFCRIVACMQLRPPVVRRSALQISVD